MGRLEFPPRRASVPIAKNRLKYLLVSDRIQCTPDKLDNLTYEIYRTISKYVHIDESSLQFSIDEEKVHLTFSVEEE